MARKRKPCEFCESEWFNSEDRRNVFYAVEAYPDNGIIGITIQGKDDNGETTSDDSLDLPFIFCPNCGRELGF